MFKIKLVYFSFPYSKAPEKYREQAVAICLKLQELYPDWCILIPHLTSNWHYDGNGKKPVDTVITSLRYDIELIDRSDLCVFPNLEDMSYGCQWEYSYCLSKKPPKSVYFFKDLLEGKVED